MIIFNTYLARFDMESKKDNPSIFPQKDRKKALDKIWNSRVGEYWETKALGENGKSFLFKNRHGYYSFIS